MRILPKTRRHFSVSSWKVFRWVWMASLWLPWSISVTQHSSRAPDGLWTFASITPFAPFRLTANDAGWFTFKPDSCSTTHTHTLNTVSPLFTTDQIIYPTLPLLTNNQQTVTQYFLLNSITITTVSFSDNLCHCLPYLEVANKAKEEGWAVWRQTKQLLVSVKQKLKTAKEEKV